MLQDLVTKKNFIFLFKILGFFLVAFFMQFLAMSHLAFEGVVPNLLLVCIVYISLHLGLEVALPFALAVAILFDSIIGGKSLFLGWLLLPFMTQISQLKLAMPKFMLKIFQVMLCTVYFELVNISFMAVFNGLEFYFQNLLMIIISALLNGLLAAILFNIFYKIFPQDSPFAKYY